ncbi:MAG TPA: oligopeptide transporter, OPT family [Bryobacteraceae bacterium]|nr:oligopeptide transporter, OPT family [Bryobacteraceae bacterium]
MNVPPNRPELTVKAVGLGLFLAFVFGSANAYLGMKAGQTVAATIPAAVIALALFRLPWFRGGVLEQNIARTAASVGEALVAGAIFTIPAFMLVEMGGTQLWSDLRSHYWQAAFILLAGGLIGVFFIILLRRPLCVESDLPWPESVASAEIVKAGDRASDAPRYLFGAMAFGAVVQFLKSDRGLAVFREFSQGFLPFPRWLVRPEDGAGEVVHGGGIAWTTPSLSPALAGIGYIIGPELAAVNTSGGVIAWWLLIPLMNLVDPNLAVHLGLPADASWDTLSTAAWSTVVRPIAVGTMLVGACYTLFSMRDSIVRSLKGAFAASAEAGREGAAMEDSEKDIPPRWIVISVLALLVPITGIYFYFTQGIFSAVVAALVMTLVGFLLSAVGGYLVGLVGSSNQPVSGLTLAALVVAALVMVALGVKGMAGVAAVLGVAAVVCCACCVSGSLIQDLKAGHLLGGTPWKMELVEILAVVLLAFFLIWPITVLHEAYGIGSRALPAPQAGLMAQLAKGIVSGQMAWGLIAVGAAFGVALIMSGARSPMLIAVGMYLPFETVSAIFVGGVLRWITDRIAARRTAEARAQVEEKGTLLASGLIAGEAIIGIFLAVLAVREVPSLTRLLTGADQFGFYENWGGWLSLVGFAALAYVLVGIPISPQRRRER